jgi:acyl CoA:acetate/3-ketoacid CoA transferase
MGTITELMRKPVIVRFVTIPDMFSNLEGGIIDIAALGFLQVDRQGNVNPSISSDRIFGPGGFQTLLVVHRKPTLLGFYSVPKKIYLTRISLPALLFYC